MAKILACNESAISSHATDIARKILAEVTIDPERSTIKLRRDSDISTAFVTSRPDRSNIARLYILCSLLPIGTPKILGI
ncbi:MAG: hypothetical protein AAF950_17235 [Pseudomonadota bacterium]